MSTPAARVGDNTLIQTGTEQDIASNGTRTYTAWWELIPEPETVITTMTVHANDRMHAEISESVAGSNVWTIVLTDRTTGKTFKKTTPYSSSHLTAEWIQERPTLIGTNGTSLAPLPMLTNPVFDFGKVNGALAGLKVPQEILMTDASANVIGSAVCARPQCRRLQRLHLHDGLRRVERQLIRPYPLIAPCRGSGSRTERRARGRDLNRDRGRVRHVAKREGGRAAI